MDLFTRMNFDGGQGLDSFFWFVSGMWMWVPVCIVAIWLLYRNLGWKYTLVAIVFIALSIVAADHVANFFKKFAPRLRPTHEPQLEGLVHMVNGYKGGSYGTMSAHAATVFTFVAMTIRLIRSNIYAFFVVLWALLVSYSRIYLGVHYPLDVFYGIVAGMALGSVTVHLLRIAIFKLGYQPRQDVE